MTFETFKKIAEERRPDIRVSRHGDYCSNVSKNTLGITFLKNGVESRVYNYSGTYAEVLDKLNIPTVTKDEYDFAKYQLNHLIETNGDDTGFEGFTFDNTEEIKYYQDKINAYDSGLYVKVWEV